MQVDAREFKYANSRTLYLNIPVCAVAGIASLHLDLVARFQNAKLNSRLEQFGNNSVNLCFGCTHLFCILNALVFVLVLRVNFPPVGATERNQIKCLTRPDFFAAFTTPRNTLSFSFHAKSLPHHPHANPRLFRTT
jgi:hypothetical protein